MYKKASVKSEIIKGIFLALVVCVAVVLMTSSVFAYKLYCLNYGESLPDEDNPRYTCFHDTCQVCATDANNPTHPAHCNNIGACQALDGNGNTTIDAEPPVFNVSSPQEGAVYDSRKVPFEIESGEPSTFTYTDNIDGRGRIKNMARNIFFYSRALSFKDGLNDITIFGNDRFGNTAEFNITFFVDSKKPRVSKTYPRRGFANGEFAAEFVEMNPETLTLTYGNDGTGFRDADVNLDNCTENRGRQYCTVDVDLDDYDGEDIEYWFELEDISGKIAQSRATELSVDITSPELVNSDDFWYQGEGRYQRYIYFDLEIDEVNFDQVTYIDNEDSRGRERRICSRLRDDRCIKRVSFRTGHHELDVQITDEAGNAIGTERVIFDVE